MQIFMGAVTSGVGNYEYYEYREYYFVKHCSSGNQCGVKHEKQMRVTYRLGVRQ